VSPVFRHGRLRLYLLKLLDEAPRHGYEVIRLLQDRFLGVYAPSPGTIYPRLARLEEEGLVTHDEIDGKKVYRITEKGREEIRSRLDDLADLEEELTESVRGIAREVSQDVRDTVRSLREELGRATRDLRGEDRERAESDPDDDAARLREEARRAREQMRDAFRAQRDRGRRDWDWRASGAAWQQGQGWPGSHGDASPPGAGAGPKSRSRPGGAGWDAGLLRDLERMAIEFAGELRAAGERAGGMGENAATTLRGILEDALGRIRDEVFRGPARPGDAPGEPDGAPTAEPHEGEPDDAPTAGPEDR
jgi:DNA-binding PadR family transcriptional regulator